MKLRLTILCENSVERVSPTGLLAEHGFACHLQTEQGDYLFDTGGGLSLLHNSNRLNIDLQQLQGVILSHGHLDHCGGLAQVLQLRKTTPVYAHPDLFGPHYYKNGDQLRDIGLPWQQKQLESLGAEFHLSTAPQAITDALLLSGQISSNQPFAGGDPHLVTKAGDGTWRPDPLADDQSLFINSKNGLIILLGCAHAGLLNIIEQARQLTGQNKIQLLLGGTHLKFCSPEQLDSTLEQLAALDIERIGAAHCTGLQQAQKIAARFGDRFFFATVGSEITFSG